MHGALRRMRFRVGEAILGFDILLTPTMPQVVIPHGDVCRGSANAEIIFG